MNNSYCHFVIWHRIGYLFLSKSKHAALSSVKIIMALIALFFVLSTSVTQAVTKTATTGNYNTASTWTPSGVPARNDDVIVPSGVTLTVNANTAALRSITVNAGGTIIPTGTRTVTATTITVNGTYINQSSSAITGTNISFGAGSLYQHAVNGGFIPIAAWDATSTCEITGYTSTSGNPPNYTTIYAQEFGNFIWDCTQTQSISLGGILTTIKGDCTVKSTGSAVFSFGNTGIGNVTIDGNYSQTGGTVYGSGWTSATAAATRTFNIAGDFNITGGTFNLSTSNDAASATTLNIGKNFTQGSGATITETGSSTGSSIRFVASETPHVYTSAGTTSNVVNFIVDNGATLQMGTASNPSAITGAGKFTLQSGATLNVTSPAGISATGTNTGNIQSTGTRSYSDGNIVYAGNSPQATGNGLTTAANVSILNITGVVTFTVKAAVDGNISMAAGATANLGTGFTHTASSLTLGGVNQSTNNTYGGNSSPASIKNGTYFPYTTSGIIKLGDCIAGSWTGSVSTDWHTPGNWCSNKVPTASDNVTISAATNQPLIGAAAVCNNITINAGATVKISGSNTLTVSGTFNNYGSFTTNAGTLTVAGAFANGGSFYGNTGTLVINSSTTSAFTNNGTFTAGTGTVNLNGGAQTVVTPSQTQFYNVIVGGTGLKTINATNFVVMGTLSMEAAGTISALPTYGTPATLQYNKPATFTTGVEWPATFSSTGGVVVKNTGVITLSANKTLTNCPLTVYDGATLDMSTRTIGSPNALKLYCGGTTAGATISGSGLLTLGGNVNVINAAKGNKGATVSCPVALTAATSRTFNVADDGTAATDLTMSGIISTTGSLVKEGMGTLTLAGANTYSGGTELNNGTLAINSSTALGASAGVFTINGGEIDNNSAGAVTLTNNNPLELNADLTFTGTKSLNLGTGIITMIEDRTITTNANTLTLGGSLLAGSYNLTKAGAGILSFGSQAVTLNNLTIIAGGLTSTSGNLSIAGDLVNSSTFTHNNGTVNFNGTGTQNINNGVSSFYNFTVTNTSATCTAGNSITSTGTYATSAGSTLDMAAFPLSVAVVNHAGTLLTRNTSATPITTGKTWGGLVNYNGTAEQTAVAGTYNDLTISTPGGATAGGDLMVNGVLNLDAASPNTTKGTLEMTKNYGDYSDIFTETALLTTTRTQAHDILDSWILYMGVNATTIGQGDVTGKVKRTSISENVEYSFGNANSTIIFNKNTTGTLPTALMFVITKGPDRGIHANKPNTVARLYQIIRTGGDLPTTFSIKLHYSEGELNGNAKSNLVLWDHHIPYNSNNTPHEHGKSAQSTTENWVSLIGHGINYLDDQEVIGGTSKYWMISNTLLTGNTWLGAVTGDETEWNNPSNWTGGHVPGCSDNVIIPVTTYYPVLPGNASAKSITIDPGATLNGGSGTLTLCGGIANNGGIGSWNNNGTFNPGTSTVVFDFPRTTNAETSTISGATNFYNITLTAGTTLIMQSDAIANIGGSFSKSGLLFAGIYKNVFNYTGANQTVAAPEDNYYHLTLSGSGTKTLPSTLTVNHDFSLDGTIGTSGTTLNVGGNFTNNSSGTFNVGTINLNGSTPQTISGTNVSLNNLTVNNTQGVLLSNNASVAGTLTLSNGLLTTTSANKLTVACAGTISGASAASYINGPLAIMYCGTGSKAFPIGKGGNYRPLTLNYTALTGTSTVTAEQFETTIPGSIPENTTYQSDRYWAISQSGGSAFTYTLALNGTPFNQGDGEAVILKGDGITNTALEASYSTPNFSTKTGLTSFSNFAVASSCEAPAIQTQPVAATACEGAGTSQFSVAINETLSVSYQWQVSTTGTGGTFNNISNGGYYSNVTTADLTVNNPSFNMNGYAYRVVVSRQCGSSVTSDAAILAVTPILSTVLVTSYYPQNICISGAGIELTATETGGGTITTRQWGKRSVSGGTITNISGAASQTYTPTGSDLGVGTWYLVCSSTPACGSTMVSNEVTVTIDAANTWLGGTNTSWNEPLNWSCGVPIPASNVTINPGTTYSPIVNINNAVCNDLIIVDGATLTINPGQLLTVGGKITGAGTAAQAGKIRVKASPNGTSANGSLIIDCDANSTLVGTERTLDKIYGTIEFYTKAWKNEAATSWKDEITGSPTKGTTFNTKYKWQFFGVPVKEVVTNPTFYGSYLRKYREDLNDPKTAKWEILNNADKLEAFYGYEITQPAPKTIEIAGELQFCDKTLSLSRKAPVATDGIHFGLGQNIFGNSYTAAIKISEMTIPPTVDQTVYLYNTGSLADWNAAGLITSPGNNATMTAGSYISIPWAVSNTVWDDQIPSMQGFLLKYTTTETVFNDNSAQNAIVTLKYDGGGVTGNTRPQLAPQVAEEPLKYLRVNLQSASTVDNLWLFSREGASSSFDNGWDGRKHFGTPTAFIYSMTPDGPMQVNTDRTIDGSVINFYANSDTDYTLTLVKSNLDEYSDLKLIDFGTKTVTPLTAEMTRYNFSSSNAGVVEKRFMIVNSASKIDFKKNDFELLYGYLNPDKTLVITNFTGEQGTLTLAATSGVTVMNETLATGTSHFPTSLMAGAYILTLQAGTSKSSIKILVNNK